MTRHGGRHRPGYRLRALASRICSATAMTRVIVPVIADLQAEYAEAAGRKQVWPAGGFGSPATSRSEK